MTDEFLERWIEDCKRCEAELARLREELEKAKEQKTVMHYWAKDYKEERDRLREALERIAKEYPSPGSAVIIARNALKEKEAEQ